MRTKNRQGPIADIIVGIVGAIIGGYFLSPLFKVGTSNQGNFSIPAMFWCHWQVAGSIILLATSNSLRNIRGCPVIVVLSLDIYVYFNGWSMASNGRPSCVLYQHQSLAIPAIIALPLGAKAGELIAPVVYAMRFGLTVKRIRKRCYHIRQWRKRCVGLPLNFDPVRISMHYVPPNYQQAAICQLLMNWFQQFI